MANNCKYYKEKQQVSYDFGVTWLDTGDYRKGSLIDIQSSDCPVVFSGKWLATYSGGTTSSAECDSTSAITSGEVATTNILDVQIGSCVTSIGGGAFQRCSGLTSVTIPNSVTSIGNYAFSDCYSLTSIDIPSGVTSIGNSAFYWCYGLTSIDIPNSVTSIGGGAFQRCSGLTSCTIGSGVTSIGNYTFQGCRSLPSVTIPNSVTSIGYNAFNNCGSLSSITIPDSVTSIGGGAFERCSGLTSITVEATTPPTLVYTSAFDNTNDCPIYVPCGSVNAYKAASGWSNYTSRIQGIPPCSEPQYRQTSGTPYCTGVDKYQDVYDQVSYDSGSTWQTTATTSVLIEAQSTDCGYVPPSFSLNSYINDSHYIRGTLTGTINGTNGFSSSFEHNGDSATQTLVGNIEGTLRTYGYVMDSKYNTIEPYGAITKTVTITTIEGIIYTITLNIGKGLKGQLTTFKNK